MHLVIGFNTASNCLVTVTASTVGTATEPGINVLFILLST